MTSSSNRNLSSFPILALAGTPGAGKTTLALNTFGNGKSLDAWAWVLNDTAPSAQSIDGAGATNIQQISSVVSIPGGCFTCKGPDVASLFGKLAADPGIKGAVYEGKGSTTGNDTYDGLAQAGIRPAIVTLVDAHYLDRNQRTFRRALDSQIAAATVAIGITKVHEDVQSIDDERLGEIRSYITRLRRSGVPIFIATKGEPMPQWVLDRVYTLSGSPIRRLTMAYDGASAHDHNHGHDHLPDYSFFLKPSIAIEDVRAIFAGLPPEEVARAKCVVSGHKWDYLYGEWQKSNPDVRTTGMLMILPPRVLSESTLATLEKITQPSAEVTPVSITEALRQELPAEEATRLVAEWETLIPETPVFGSLTGLVVTNPEEMQVVRELARQKSVPAEQANRIVSRCVRYWLAVTPVLSSQRNRHNPDEYHSKQRDLAAALSFWVTQQAGTLDQTIITQTSRLLPKLIIEGFEALKEAPDDGGDASCSKFRRGVQLCIKHGMRPEEFRPAAKHCLNLALSLLGENETANRWRAIVAELSD